MKKILTWIVFLISYNVYPNVTVIPYGSSWKYKDDGSNQGYNWRSSAFNDISWQSGNGQLGYGDGDETTVLNAGCTPFATCTTKFITTYFRKNFSIASTATFINYTLNVKRDDGIIIYIDSIEVYRNNMPAGVVSSTTVASAACADDGNGIQSTTLLLAQLASGNHMMQVEVHQSAASSSDISFDLELIANENNASVIRGPYLNLATQNSVHIRWRTNIPTNSVVNYGTINGALVSTVSNATLTTEHDIDVTGLLNDTRYFYSIGNTSPAAQTLNTGSDYYFYTLPLKGTQHTTRIWAFGDCGNNSSNQINVRNQYMKYMNGVHTDAILLMGDNSYNAGTDVEYSTNFFPLYQDSVLRNVILWPAPGNHDYANTAARQDDHAVPYFDMFTLPANGESGGIPSGTEAYYSFDIGNIHFLSLDSYGKDSNTYLLYDTLGAQVRWIKQDLAANTQKWTIAYWHHPPYTMGSHNSDTYADLAAIRQNFIQILERNGVDLILCGHSHVYERSYLLNGHYGLASTFDIATHAKSSSSAKYDNSTNSCPYIKSTTNKKGTVYVVVGSAGQLGGQQVTWPHPAMYYSNNSIGGGLAITVDGNRLDAAWVCSDGVVRDKFTMMKDVNQKTLYTIPEGDSLTLTSSWKGTYNWPGGYSTKMVKVSPPGLDIDTLVVTDNFNCLKDSFIVTKTIALPVELLKLDAAAIGSNINVSWQTAGEMRILYFEIEWSADGVVFKNAGQVPVNGTMQYPHNYNFLHTGAKEGMNYYRLKIVDTDSEFTYSAIVNAEIKTFNATVVKNNFINVYPNPSGAGQYNVDYYSPAAISSYIRVYDLTGRVVYKDELKILNGITHYFLKIGDLPGGVYLVNIDKEIARIKR